MNESILFNYLKENYFPDLERSTGRYDKWDCYSPSTKTRIELKCRRKHYPNLILEKIKYVDMVKRYVEEDEKPVYINSTPNGIFAFDLRNIKPNWITDKRLPHETNFERITPIEKTYTLINIEEGKKI
jgi:hypothetical protein